MKWIRYLMYYIIFCFLVWIVITFPKKIFPEVEVVEVSKIVMQEVIKEINIAERIFFDDGRFNIKLLERKTLEYEDVVSNIKEWYIPSVYELSSTEKEWIIMKDNRTQKMYIVVK